MALLALVQNLITRLAGWVTCIATLPWIGLLALSVSIDLISPSARVTSVKFQKGLSVSETIGPIDRTPGTPGSHKNCQNGSSVPTWFKWPKNGQIARNCTTGPKWFKSPRMVQNVSKTAQLPKIYQKDSNQKWPGGLFQKYLLEVSEFLSQKETLLGRPCISNWVDK